MADSLRSEKRESDLSLPEGLEAGLIGGFAVAAVYLVHDFAQGDWLYTPRVLGTLLYAGPDVASMVAVDPIAAEIGMAPLYHIVHFTLWTLAGFLATALAKLAVRRPELRFFPVLLLAGFVAFFFALDSEVEATNIARLHLWAGGLAGGALMSAYLLWRHPSLLRGGTREDTSG
jgi:hypothetical protein